MNKRLKAHGKEIVSAMTVRLPILQIILYNRPPCVPFIRGKEEQAKATPQMMP
jgi:hypothetical protein